MQEIIQQILTPQVMMVFRVLGFFLVALYVLSIIWVIRDSYLRGAYPWLWGIVAIVPLLGLVAYLILRPSMYSVDRQEQDLEIALKERQLEHFGNCPVCGGAIEHDFIVCPKCNTQVRNVCTHCHKPLEPDWSVCPYCRTKAQR